MGFYRCTNACPSKVRQITFLTANTTDDSEVVSAGLNLGSTIVKGVVLRGSMRMGEEIFWGRGWDGLI